MFFRPLRCPECDYHFPESYNWENPHGYCPDCYSLWERAGTCSPETGDYYDFIRWSETTISV